MTLDDTLTTSRRKFAVNNKDRPIKAWGVCCIQGRGTPPPQAVTAFFQKFVQIYESHGGIVMSHPTHGKAPWMGPGNLAEGGDMSKYTMLLIYRAQY